MLIEAINHMHHSSMCCGSIFGQEKNVVNSAIAKMNLFLHDNPAEDQMAQRQRQRWGLI